MSVEIEIKLALGTTGPEELRQHPLLQARHGQVRLLGNTYFDTPTGELEAARMALRLRRDGDCWIQTLKTDGKGSGGYSRRREWEWSVSTGVLDHAVLGGLPEVSELTPDVLARLQPRFTTDFERHLWHLEFAGASIEVALDQGEILAAGQRVPIRELELELKEGDPQALWELALNFAETVPLRPADASKAARGSALLEGEWQLPSGTTPHAWLHRASLALDAYADTGEPHWQTLARESLRALAANGYDEAGQLAAKLAAPDWLDISPDFNFGRTALRLAQRLATHTI